MPSLLEKTGLRELPSAGFWERAVLGRLSLLKEGELTVETSRGIQRFGQPVPDGLKARLKVNSHEAWEQMALGGSLGAAEGYMAGWWETEDLTSLIRLFIRNQGALESLESGLARWGQAAARLYHLFRANTRSGSKRNISAHYDLGNDFYQLMLDPTMSYSSAYFEPGDSLEKASIRKVDRILGLLGLEPGQNLLEIGTGWGFLSRRAASAFGARVTTTTLSKEQHAYAVKKLREEGLEGRVTQLLTDYRDLSGTFDHLVSVEMIEAVGAEYYGTFFKKCAGLLKAGGRLALQAITIEEPFYESARKEADFIKRYVFPGSNIPSVSALVGAASPAGLIPTHLEEWGIHYATTLAAWRDNLRPHKDWVVKTYGERFWRLWDYYLGYCEGGFREGHIRVGHLVFEKSKNGPEGGDRS